MIQPIYEEYQQYTCKCSGCGHRQTANFPNNLTSSIQYGSSVDMLASYLSVYQSIPYNRLKKMLFQVFSLPPSKGTVNTILDSVALKCETVYEHIKVTVSRSSVVGSDETGVKIVKKKYWFKNDCKYHFTFRQVICFETLILLRNLKSTL